MTSVSVAGILLFPALAMAAYRAGGTASLWRAVGLGVGVILLLALVLATSWAVNALASTYGYVHTASRTLMFFGLTLALPLISAGFAVHKFAHLRPQIRLYAIGILFSLSAWIVGISVSVRALYAM